LGGESLDELEKGLGVRRRTRGERADRADDLGLPDPGLAQDAHHEAVYLLRDLAHRVVAREPLGQSLVQALREHVLGRAVALAGEPNRRDHETAEELGEEPSEYDLLRLAKRRRPAAAE